jgi:acyl dehydratase
MTAATGTPRATRILRSLTASEIAGYRQATRLGMSKVEGNPLMPSPVQPFVLAFSAFSELMTELGASSSIHLSQEIVSHRPVRPDEQVTVEVDIVGMRREAKGDRLTLRAVLVGGDGTTFAELTTGVLMQALSALEPFGVMPVPAAPPAGPAPGQETLVTRQISVEMIQRYAAASGDANPVHLDGDAARAAGFPGVIAHGMNVLAIACEEASDLFAPRGSGWTVASLGGRFSAAVSPDEPIAITFEPGASDRVTRFTCRTEQGVAIKNGWIRFASDERTETHV